MREELQEVQVVAELIQVRQETPQTTQEFKPLSP